MLKFGWGLYAKAFLKIAVIVRHGRVAGLQTLSSVQKRGNLAGLRLLIRVPPPPPLASGDLAVRVSPVNKKLMRLACLCFDCF